MGQYSYDVLQLHTDCIKPRCILSLILPERGGILHFYFQIHPLLQCNYLPFCNVRHYSFPNNCTDIYAKSIYHSALTVCRNNYHESFPTLLCNRQFLSRFYSLVHSSSVRFPLIFYQMYKSLQSYWKLPYSVS